MERSAPTAPPPAPPDEPRTFCPRCGAAYEAPQEYCLECGERLPVNSGVVGVLASGWQRRFARYPGNWIWPSLLFLLLAVAAAAVAILAGHGRTTTTVGVATSDTVPLATPTATTSTVETSTGTLPTPPEPPTTPQRTPPPKPRPHPSAPGGILAWPRGRTGYTIVLESIPTRSGRGVALARARRAKTAGLSQVGVLTSANYSSLHPGYYVVFQGIYGSSADASAGLAAAHAHGFRDAYQTQVTR